MSNLLVQNIKHTNNTTAMTVDSSGNTALNFVTAKTPAFKARLNADQTINQSTWTQVQFSVEEIDNKGWHDTSAYRYTPQQAGFYLFTLNLFQSPGTGNSQRRIGAISKNGTYHRVWDHEITSGASVLTNGSILLEANGSSDYFEAFSWAQTSNASSVVLGKSDYTNWSGFLVTAT
tara:strand:+ start:154 stop:681 length:528 start_codon:yes stop_codon:yes gene_type:complete